MKAISTLLLFFLCCEAWTQDYKKLNKVDSLCTLIDEDKNAQRFSFDTTIISPGYFPMKSTYDVTVKAGFITKIEYRHREVRKEENPTYAFDHSTTIYFYWGTVMKYDEYEGTVPLDTTIAEIPKRILSGKSDMEWSLHIHVFKNELLHYYSNGHGITETDAFNVEEHYRSAAARLKRIVKEKQPGVK